MSKEKTTLELEISTGGANKNARIQHEIGLLFEANNLSFNDGMLLLMTMIGIGMNGNPTAPAQMEFELDKYIILVSEDKSLLPHREEIDQALAEETGEGKTKH